MKIVVTGAGGFLGAAVTAAALRAGHDVVAVVRRADPARLRGIVDEGGAVVEHTLDIADSDVFERVLTDTRPDVVVHGAWAGLASVERDSPEQIAQMEA